LSPNGCIIASSREAKALGIKTGFRVVDALKICPTIELVENDPAKYRATTEKIFAILNRYSDDIEPYSIDEAFLDLTGHVPDLSAAANLGRQIQQVIRDEVGSWLGASVGVSFTRFLAKLAGDLADKGGVLVLDRAGLPEFYSGIELTDIWGIDHRLEARFHHLGITTPLQLMRYPVANLMQVMGKMGYYLWASLNGQDIGRVQRPAQPKSVGHSYCLPIKTTDLAYHKKILMKLSEKTGRRLRHLGLLARGLNLWWSEEAGGGHGTHRRLPSPINGSWTIFQEALKLFAERNRQRRILQLAVSVFDLVPPSHQLALFANPNHTHEISRAVDTINDRFGEYTVFWGEMWGSGKNAPDRIGFRKTLTPTFHDTSPISSIPD
jgi:DNA polymerase-4